MLTAIFITSVSDIENNIGVGFMIIKNIGDLLPKSFDAKIRYTICDRMAVSSTNKILSQNRILKFWRRGQVVELFGNRFSVEEIFNLIDT